MKPRSTIVALLFIFLCIGAVAPSLVAAQQDPQPPPTNPGEGEPPRPSDYCYRPTPCVCCVYIHLPGFSFQICVEESWRAECGGDTGGITAPVPQTLDPTLLVNGALVEDPTPLGFGLDPMGLGELVALKRPVSTVANGGCPATLQSPLNRPLSHTPVGRLPTTYGGPSGGTVAR